MSFDSPFSRSGLPQGTGQGQPRRATGPSHSCAQALFRFGSSLTALGAAFVAPAGNYLSSKAVPPEPVREFRAAWVATVANIDWPSKKTLTTKEQQAELVAIMDRAVQLHLNAIVFQVRPACDAVYSSRIEPWSEYLTGTMGKAPEPFYDPLAFAIAEAHKRGLELHAWFNPFRARLPTATSPIAANHVSKTRPQLVRQYGESLWLDPGEKEVQDYSLSVVMDVVRRYDVDGVHLDDYFYPYKVKNAAGKELDFPDDSSWRRFGARGKLSRDDWRRENVNSFVYRLYASIKAAKPWVKFGISPFGIWRTRNPPQINGLDAYATLYADSRKWLANGWVDYLAPQLYWKIGSPDTSFPVLLRWWAEQNPKGRNLYAGMDATKVSRPESLAPWPPQEIVDQIRLTRKQRGADGHIHWNATTLMSNRTLDAILEKEVYQQPALTPLSPWLGQAQPSKPDLTGATVKRGAGLQVCWKPGSPGKPWLWLLQTRANGEWTEEILPARNNSRAWPRAQPEIVALRAVDRTGQLSAPSVLQAPTGAR